MGSATQRLAAHFTGPAPASTVVTPCRRHACMRRDSSPSGLVRVRPAPPTQPHRPSPTDGAPPTRLHRPKKEDGDEFCSIVPS
jgi:hypothetical protein